MRPHHKHQHGAIFFAIVVSFYSRSDFRVQWRIRAAAGDARLRLSLVGMHFRPIQASRWQLAESRTQSELAQRPS